LFVEKNHAERRIQHRLHTREIEVVPPGRTKVDKAFY
jgi:hypothetical protein